MAQAPLVGRSDELARLAAMLSPSAPGCRVILVGGEPGIGKTRLAHEAVACARAADSLVLEGRADPLGAATAYAPIVDAIGRCLRGLSEKRRASLVDGLPDLRRLFVGITGPMPAATADPQLEKTRLFEAIAQLLERLAGDGVLVLSLDDLHWADRATFELVLHLVRRTEDARIVVLGTCRSDPAEATEGFTILVSMLRRMNRLDEVALSRLSGEDTLALARGILGDATPVQLVDLLARAGGVPLFIEMIVRSLVEDGRLVPGPLGWSLSGSAPGDVPAVVREMLAARLARLSSDERRVIDGLAVAGGETSHDELARVLDVSSDALSQALEPLRAAAFVVEDDASGEVRYTAGHPLVLEVAYAALGAAVRRALHRRFVDELEQRGAPAARIARHYRGAGTDVDGTRATSVLVAAGERALEIGAEDEAAQNLAVAVALLRPAGGAALAATLERLGVAWERGGKGAAARTVWQEALALVGSDPTACARLYHRIGRVEFDGGELAAARTAYAAGLDVLGGRITAERAQLHRSRAQLFDRMADVVALEGEADALAQVAEGLELAPVRVAAALARTRVHFARGDFASASAALADAFSAAGADDRLELEVAELGIVIASERGDMSTATAHAERTFVLAKRLGSAASELRARGYLATMHLFSGAWGDAERLLAIIATFSRRYQIPRGESRGRGLLGILTCFRGDLDGAARLLSEARAIASQLHGDRYLDASIAMAEWWLASERDERHDDATLIDLDARLAVPGDMRCLRRLCRAELAASVGRTDDALAISSALALADSAPFHQAASARAEAAARDALGELDAARAARTRAAAAWAAAGLPFEATRDRLRAISGVTGDVAIAEATACLAAFEQLGAQRWADRARKRLRELGVRPAPVRRPGVGGGPLSKRELEVARAYAEGLSTAQVAERLVISPHTASTHLQRIYQRLGLNSRAALTRYLMDEGLL